MKKKLLIYFSFITFCYSINSSSQTTTNFNPLKDNSIYSESNNSNGLGQLFSGKTGINNGNNNRRALIKFDISSIPIGAKITNATLMLNVSQVSFGAGAENYNIYQLTKDWGEGSSNSVLGTGATAIAPDCTWSDATLGTSLWTTQGGDFSATSLSSLNITGTGNYTFLSNSNFVNTVQNWLDNSSINFGVILIGDESISNSARKFGSKDLGVSPILSVQWTNPLSTEEFAYHDFKISPNPAKDFIQVKFSETISNIQIDIYNVLGKQMYSKLYTSNTPINISYLNTGLYFLKVSSDGIAKTKKIIKY